ncbi:ABC transporter ATP-binding protein [Patescibacteria group bacterium]|nr:ABC transporter ATP-binding protein [Patescibacteria group bacterium]MBP9710359.1 ABC transporter ATP-binding protein [Patescibacteria group bacterium]
MTPYAKRALHIYWQHIRLYKWRVFAVLSMVIVNMILWVVYPLYYKDLFDALVNMQKTGIYDWEVIKRIFLIIFAIYMVMWALWRACGLIASDIQPRIGANLQRTVFKNVLDHSYQFFTEEPSGSLVKKASRFVDAFHNIVEPVLWRLFPTVITIGGMLIIFWRMEWVLGVMLGVWSLAFFLSDLFVSRWKLPLDERRSEMDSKASGLLTDSLTNAVNIKLFVTSSREQASYGGLVDEQRRAQTKSWQAFEVSLAIQTILMTMIEFAIMGWAVYRFTQGAFTIGDVAALQGYLVLLFNQVWDFGRFIRTIYEQMANAKEMVEVMDKISNVQDEPNAKQLKVTQGIIEFKKLDFAYTPTRKILRDVSLSIKPGEKIALVGSSGAGKSTVTKLLLRLFNLNKGKILIDGQDIAKVTQDSLRQNIALVPQDPILFHRSLKDNIRYGKPDATEEELIAASKQAHCHEFISSLPEGYDSLVGERGVKLSGGERQRVAVARAILMNAPILILDEATSSLDSESEALIQDALAKLMQGKTVIAIAHRLSTIMQMDRIIVMQDGRILDEGKHNDLLSRDGLYKSLWSIQAGGFLAE